MNSRHRLGKGESKLTYEGYLKVPELIGLQQLESDPPHHDELLFIITHQAYELWFKQILFELDQVVLAMESDDLGEAIHGLRRVTTIEQLLVRQIHILETMTPVDFLGFRDHLNPASGFQSVQFREMEFLSGLKRESILNEFQGDPGATERLQRRLQGISLPEALRGLLRRQGIPQPEGDDERSTESRVLGLAEVYESRREKRDLYDLCEGLLEHDSNIQLWRFHHVAMVERMIGRKIGTGGSEGVGYLMTTLKHRFFPDLWAARSHLRGPEEREG